MSSPTTTGTFSEANGVPWVIGNNGGTTEFPWEGLIDDVAIFQRALPDEEILSIASGTTTSSTWVEPWVNLSRQDDGTLRVDFVGILETSPDLTPDNWSAIAPLPCSPYIFTPPPEASSLYFRARSR